MVQPSSLETSVARGSEGRGVPVVISRTSSPLCHCSMCKNVKNKREICKAKGYEFFRSKLHSRATHPSFQEMVNVR